MSAPCRNPKCGLPIEVCQGRMADCCSRCDHSPERPEGAGGVLMVDPIDEEPSVICSPIEFAAPSAVPRLESTEYPFTARAGKFPGLARPVDRYTMGRHSLTDERGKLLGLGGINGNDQGDREQDMSGPAGSSRSGGIGPRYLSGDEPARVRRVEGVADGSLLRIARGSTEQIDPDTPEEALLQVHRWACCGEGAPGDEGRHDPVCELLAVELTALRTLTEVYMRAAHERAAAIARITAEESGG